MLSRRCPAGLRRTTPDWPGGHRTVGRGAARTDPTRSRRRSRTTVSPTTLGRRPLLGCDTTGATTTPTPPTRAALART
ncbi:MAG: hypothetical protein ACRDRJ_51740, partial [Streptosporangiaceae bacterium]